MGWNALADLMTSKKVKPAQMGTGLLARAAAPIASDADYQAYVLDAQEKGQQALPRAEWLKSQSNG